MRPIDDAQPDVMQVCRNGHVITDLLRTFPERGLSHCDRCGAPTLNCCPTCGGPVPGSIYLPGFVPIGVAQPPQYCAMCGAPFPWAQPAPASPSTDPVLRLDSFLRRLPRVIRQLRERHDARPPFRVEDEHDLEDLLRSLLPLYFDDIRPERRTPGYATGTRTDFLLLPEEIVLLVKRVASSADSDRLAAQLQQDVTYYQQRGRCSALVCFVYDPEQRIPRLKPLETAGRHVAAGHLTIHWVIAS